MKSPYQRQLEKNLEASQRKAETFFRKLLAQTRTMPSAKLLLKSPAALAAAYAIFTLMDEKVEPDTMLLVLGTTRRLFESEMAKAREAETDESFTI